MVSKRNTVFIILIIITSYSFNTYAQNSNKTLTKLRNTLDVGIWIEKTPMEEGRKGMASIVIDGQIYLIGGSSNVDNTTVSSVLVYDPLTDSYISKANMSTSKTTQVVLVDGLIYALGSVSVTSSTTSFLKAIEVYDPSTDTWTNKNDMNEGIAKMAVQSVDNLIYVIGGHDSQGKVYNTTRIYNPTSETWTTGTSIPENLFSPGNVTIKGKIYIFGGFDGNEFKSSTYAYDPILDAWTKLKDMPQPRAYSKAIAYGDSIYVIGGSNEASGTREQYANVYLYNTLSNTWQILNEMPVTSSIQGGACIDHKLYIIGGKSGNNVLKTNYEYTIKEISSVESDKKTLFNIYPTVVGNHLSISIDDPGGIGTNVIITDMFGQKCMTIRLEKKTTLIDLSSLNTGIYFVTLLSDTGEYSKTKKILKTR